MPNYCWNYVEFKSDDQVKLNELATKFKKNQNFDYFTDFCKYLLSSAEPKKPTEQEKLYDYAYTFGTKWWDIDRVEIQDKMLIVGGDSAWSPPQLLIEQLCIKFKLDAYMNYEEPGADFGGEAWYNEHGEVEDRCYEYKQWRYMNCENKKDFYEEEIVDLYVHDGIEEFKYALEEYYSWMSSEDKLLFIEWLEEDIKSCLKTSEE